MERQQLAIIKWINDFICKYHLTLSFSYGTNEYHTRRLLERIIIHLNKVIFKNRYTKGLSSLSGFAIREHTYHKDCDHYHLVLTNKGGWLPDFERMKILIKRQINYVNRSSPLNRVSDHLLQDYYDDGDHTLEQYLTKQFSHPWIEKQKASDSIGLIGREDVVFGELKFS